MVTKEQILLRKLYEAQELMEDTLNDGKEDRHYFMICELIKRLEVYLQRHNQDIL
jgi:hypothetical protein